MIVGPVGTNGVAVLKLDLEAEVVLNREFARILVFLSQFFVVAEEVVVGSRIIKGEVAVQFAVAEVLLVDQFARLAVGGKGAVAQAFAV